MSSNNTRSRKTQHPELSIAPAARLAVGSQSIALGSLPAECRGRKIVGPLPRVSVRVHGMTPGLRQAMRVGWVRCVALLPMAHRGLPAN
jgi:hypothetical protein